MKKHILIVLAFTMQINAQRTIKYPESISSNVWGSVTKVELLKNETILHMHIKRSIGTWFSIPNKTYIEDSYKGKKLFVTKAEGVSLEKQHTFTDSNELKFKLHFPALSKGVKKINYGEVNVGGNWFIYKLNLEKDGRNSKTAGVFEVGRNFNLRSINFAGNKSPSVITTDKQLNKDETLMLIVTPDYIISGNRVNHYQNIQKTEYGKYFISHSGGAFEVLKLEENTMTLRTDRLAKYTRKTSTNKVTKFIKGGWSNGKNKLVVSDKNFSFEGDSRHIFGSKKLFIDHIAESEFGDLFWFILYSEGTYYIYWANKIDGEYILGPIGQGYGQYKKVKG